MELCKIDAFPPWIKIHGYNIVRADGSFKVRNMSILFKSIEIRFTKSLRFRKSSTIQSKHYFEQNIELDK